MAAADDEGTPIDLAGPPCAVVSLVPSLTEAIALSAPGRLVGATDWCTHPADLSVPRFGGTKNPDVAGIVAAAPDLVVANEEENKPEHVAALRRAGLPVWVTDIRTVEQALASLRRLLDVLDAPDGSWLDDADRAWAAPPQAAPDRVLALVPIWRRPWMHVGRDTYAGDVLSRLGVDNALAHDPERYPVRRLEDLPAVDLVVLPDEPYPFTDDDGPESFPVTPCALVSGRHLTWYGPAMVEAPAMLRAQLAAGLSGRPTRDIDPPSTA